MKYLLCAMLSLYGAALAAEDTFQRLARAKSLKCQFGRGTVGKWETGRVILSEDKTEMILHFDSINHKTGKARLIANQGAEDVIVLLTAAGLTFIEETTSGNLAIATVFGESPKDIKEFIAVYSRHMTFLWGGPLPSQYHGTCKVWE